jgi:hypothetical protein
VTDFDDVAQLEADPADLAEQAMPAGADNAADETERPVPLEADPADVAEQILEAGDDEEDYREA